MVDFLWGKGNLSLLYALDREVYSSKGNTDRIDLFLGLIIMSHGSGVIKYIRRVINNIKIV